MANDLISRNALLAEYDRVHIGEPGKARKLIEDAPTVDAVEVVHGRWKPQFEYDFDRGEYILTGYNCDQCGIWILKKSNYCPNCGAKMDGDGNG